MAKCDKCGQKIDALCDDCGPIHLTSRQRQVLSLVASGLTTPEVASKIHASIATVKREKKFIRDAFGQDEHVNFLSIISEAQRRGMLSNTSGG